MKINDAKSIIYITCYFMSSSTVDLDDLNKYLNDKSSIDNIHTYGILSTSCHIRIYYIKKEMKRKKKKRPVENLISTGFPSTNLHNK